MTLAELIALTKELEYHTLLMHMDPETVNVVVRSHKASIGSASYASIKSIGHGIDWDHGKIFIYTDPALTHLESKPCLEKQTKKK
jgi:hypothetical protein